MRRLMRCTLVIACLMATSRAWAIEIELQFTDTSQFNTNATARAAIQQAATDIGQVITSSLTAVNDYSWEHNITSGTQTLETSFDWNFAYTDAALGGTVNLTELLPADTVRIFVRGQSLSGSTLGNGGSAGIGFSSQYGIRTTSGPIGQGTLQNQFVMAIDDHQDSAESEYLRGSGPVISTLAGTASVEFATSTATYTASAPYEVSYGPTFGTLAFDTSFSGDFTDYWHIDHTTPVAANKNDLYSVAVHEILHALGVGSSETWNSLRNGTTWLGSEANALNGGGVGLVTTDHIAPNTMSQSIVDGAAQETAMDPSITQGTRKYLTTLDLAFLRDLGYETIVPDFGLQGDFNGDGEVNLADYTVWRDNLGAGSDAVINDSGDGQPGVTAGDYQVWRDRFGDSNMGAASLAGPLTVPEPSGMALLLAGVTALFVAGRRARSA